jgi:hypothetical protein
MRTLSLGFLSLALVACGASKDAADDSKKMSMDDASAQLGAGFPETLLSEFSSWTPVLAGDQAFSSAGHGGIMVRSYLNPKASEHVLASSSPYPMAKGSILAKTLVKSKDTPASEASRVYFMQKEAEGFDPAHNNWSYAVAKRVGASLVYDGNVNPREELCVSCHAKFSAFDYVQTVDFYLRQRTVGN